MIKKFLHIIISVLTSLVLLLPIAMQFAHSLDKEHEHVICKAKEIQHIHKVEIDCTVYHYQHNVVTTINFKHVEYTSINVFKSTPISFNSIWSKYENQSYLTRGPPIVIS